MFSHRQRMTMMIDEKLARLRAHRNNVYRYRRLLHTTLTEVEREFIERRLGEEQSALRDLAASAFPLTFRLPDSANQPPQAA
jgi:hypothetical protein